MMVGRSVLLAGGTERGGWLREDGRRKHRNAVRSTARPSTGASRGFLIFNHDGITVLTPNCFVTFTPIFGYNIIMNAPALTAFAQGREEIWLWPSAVAAYYVTLHNSPLAPILFLTSIPAGAIFYTLYGALRDIVEDQEQISHTKNRHSRSDKTEPSEVFINAWSDALDTLFPSHWAAQIITTLGMITELLLFGWSLIWLFKRIIISYPPTITEIGLISLPLLSVAIIAAKFLWNS